MLKKISIILIFLSIFSITNASSYWRLTQDQINQIKELKKSHHKNLSDLHKKYKGQKLTPEIKAEFVNLMKSNNLLMLEIINKKIETKVEEKSNTWTLLNNENSNATVTSNTEKSREDKEDGILNNQNLKPQETNEDKNLKTKAEILKEKESNSNNTELKKYLEENYKQIDNQVSKLSEVDQKILSLKLDKLLDTETNQTKIIKIKATKLIVDYRLKK